MRKAISLLIVLVFCSAVFGLGQRSGVQAVRLHYNDITVNEATALTLSSALGEVSLTPAQRVVVRRFWPQISVMIVRDADRRGVIAYRQRARQALAAEFTTARIDWQRAQRAMTELALIIREADPNEI